MKQIFILLALFSLTACTSLKTAIPSFNDPNQSARIIDVSMAVDKLDCDQPHAPQVLVIKDNLRWFELYSKSNGFRNQDVLNIIKPMQATVDDFYKRSVEKQGSKGYCELKKNIMSTQARAASDAVLGRF
jgi:hypothetical protein